MLQPLMEKDGELAPIYFHSKMLSDTEKNYPNIDRELLGVVHAMEKFSNFTPGHKTIIHTDHKPLLALFQKNIINAPPRLARLLLRVSLYDLEMVYKKGKEMYISDSLSCMPNHKADNGKTIPGLNVSIHEVYNSVDISKTYVLMIKEQTGHDHVLQQLINVIQLRWPEQKHNLDPEVTKYWNFHDEMSAYDGLVLKGYRFCIPTNLHNDILKLPHTPHMGISKALLCTRTSVYWSGVTKDIDRIVNECIQCQETQNVNKKEQMIPIDAPFPWHTLCIDNFKIDGMIFLLIVDKFSKFLIVRECSLDTSSTMDMLLDVFIQQGLPVKLISDRGSNFTSLEFTNFYSSLNINLTHTSTHHHSGHGQEE